MFKKKKTYNEREVLAMRNELMELVLRINEYKLNISNLVPSEGYCKEDPTGWAIKIQEAKEQVDKLWFHMREVGNDIL